MRGIALAVALAAPALAAAKGTERKPVWAIHPLVVIDAEGPLVAQLQQAFEEEVKGLRLDDGRPLDLASAQAVAGFLGTVDHGVCVENACLARLARAVNADFAVRVTIAPHAPQLALSGKVVNPLEADVNSVTRSFPKGKDLVASAREAIRHVLAVDLTLGAPELYPLNAPQVVPSNPPAAAAVPPAAPRPAEDRAWMRPAGYWAAGIAGAGLVAGALLQWGSAASWKEANELQGGPGKVVTQAENDRLRALEWGAPAEQGLAVASWIAAAGAAGAAAYLLVAAPPPPGPVALSAAPLPGGIAASIVITLP